MQQAGFLFSTARYCRFDFCPIREISFCESLRFHRTLLRYSGARGGGEIDMQAVGEAAAEEIGEEVILSGTTIVDSNGDTYSRPHTHKS